MEQFKNKKEVREILLINRSILHRNDNRSKEEVKIMAIIVLLTCVLVMIYCYYTEDYEQDYEYVIQKNDKKEVNAE